MKLGSEFFARPTLEVAPDLLGATLLVDVGEGVCGGRIVEVEAYLGSEDPASHAARGPTPRSRIMFGPAGVVYVYFIYGVHHCLNFVTEKDGTPGAVLIRALEPTTGLDLMARRRGCKGTIDFCNGPGKLCRALGLDLTWNGFSPGSDGERTMILEGPGEAVKPAVSTRIGIRLARQLPYRFFDRGSSCLSVK